MARIEIGKRAPAFELVDQNAKRHALKDYAGRVVVLFFYPKDDTSGCTAESKDFSALKADFDKSGVEVVGLSPDPVSSKVKFRRKHDLTVRLAADETRKTLEAYGVWVEKSMYGRKYMGIERSTFLVGADGKVAQAWRKVSVAGHAAEVLAAAKAL